jgi:hypothetical protein
MVRGLWLRNGELSALRGEGGFKARLGERGTVWRDYYFE